MGRKPSAFTKNNWVGKLKKLIKNIVNAAFTLALLPLILIYFIFTLFTAVDKTFAAFSQFLSLFPGVVGSYLRKNFFAFAMQRCSRDIFIGFNTIFSQQGTQIREGVYIGPQSNIGLCEIEKDALIGSGVHILSGKNQHNFDQLDKPIRDQGGSFESVIIGENSWVGNASIVMANVGKNCIVGAGSVVTKDLPDNVIVVGNPAKVVKARE